MVGKSSHLTFGYGERIWKCGSCGESWIACYSIPPKASRKGMPKPREGILRLTFTEGVRGYADGVVLTATVSPPAVSPDEIAPSAESVEKKGDSAE